MQQLQNFSVKPSGENQKTAKNQMVEKKNK